METCPKINHRGTLRGGDLKGRLKGGDLKGGWTVRVGLRKPGNFKITIVVILYDEQNIGVRKILILLLW